MSADSQELRSELTPLTGAVSASTGQHASATMDLPQGASEPANTDLERVMDIPVQLTVQLGRARIPIKQVLQLAQGSVIELNASAGDPMDVMVNGYLIAQGEVVVVNDKFGIRLTDIMTPAERLRRLGGN